MVDNRNPAYPNGKCACCGFGLNVNKACTNEDCTYVIELRKLIRDTYKNHHIITKHQELIEDLREETLILKDQNKKFKREMQELLNINRGQ